MDRLANHPKFQAFDSNGDPLSGGKLYTYEAGTTTNKTTYSDRALSTPNANPIVLDSRGECACYFSGTMKLVLKTSADVTVWTMDNLKALDDTVFSDDDGDTKIQLEESADEDKIRFDTGGTERLRIENDGSLTKGTGIDISLIKTGTYTGDDTVGQAITGVGFGPKFVMIWRHATGETAESLYQKLDQTWADFASRHTAGGGHTFAANQINSLDIDGFTVDDNGNNEHPNMNTEVYDYLALG